MTFIIYISEFLMARVVQAAAFCFSMLSIEAAVVPNPVGYRANKKKNGNY